MTRRQFSFYSFNVKKTASPCTNKRKFKNEHIGALHKHELPQFKVSLDLNTNKYSNTHRKHLCLPARPPMPAIGARTAFPILYMVRSPTLPSGRFKLISYQTPSAGGVCRGRLLRGMCTDPLQRSIMIPPVTPVGTLARPYNKHITPSTLNCTGHRMRTGHF